MAANVVDYGFHTSTIGDDSKTGWEQFPAHQYASVFRLCRSSANRVSSLKRGSEETESLTILQYPTVFALLPWGVFVPSDAYVRESSRNSLETGSYVRSTNKRRVHDRAQTDRRQHGSYAIDYR